jgi:alkanesulfonate monooxygenase SsuD/methylene tetrahydromethanopterin reductase-like flavin-dependent oxidoreductase (luciferase family)
MKVSVFYLPSLGPRPELEKGMAGLRDDLYQQMLADLREQAQLADEAGYEAIGFTEHHFHIEGFEISNNPVLLDLYVGLQTKRIKVGQLGIVLPASSPLRVAEDIAMLDQMTGGRAFAGFARGYQRRWVDVLAQHYYGVHGTRPGQHDEVDRVNREAFEECFRIIKKAWTEETFSFDGKYWRIPNEGTPWEIEATRRYGRGLNPDGTVAEVGVAPKPLQKPHPPLFQPFASSERTIRWCAQEGITAILPAMYDALQQRLYEVYREEALAAGRRLALGEGMGVLRDVVVAETDEEAYALWRDSGAFAGAAWFAPFGFGDVLREPGRKDAPSPRELIEEGRVLVGCVDTVSRQMERLLRTGPVDHLFAWSYVGLVPHAAQMRSLELFATKVLPSFR